MLIVVLMILSQGYAPTREGTAPLDTEREARVQRLGKQLRCAVCQGVSIADSPASMARAQLDKVRELVADEKSDDEIYDYFVERYGEWALMEPKKTGVTFGLWAFPIILLLAGGAYIVWSSKQKSPLVPVVPSVPVSTEEDPFLAQVRSDLEKSK